MRENYKYYFTVPRTFVQDYRNLRYARISMLSVITNITNIGNPNDIWKSIYQSTDCKLTE